jgi:hypothetical protein
VLWGERASDASYGNNGTFNVRMKYSRRAFVIASDGLGWQHVSVSHSDYTPTWDEMCQVKAMFWDPEDCVIQYHPPESEYVNCHRHCLHLWRPTEQAFPRPDPLLVGPIVRKPPAVIELPQT